MAKARIMRAKYSGGPNLSAHQANCGPVAAKMIVPKMPATKELTAETVSACPALP